MNKIYRLVWNKAKNVWIVASELSRSRSKRRSARTALHAGAFATLLCAAAIAAPPAPTTLPSGAKIIGGAARIAQTGAVMDIHQSTQQVAIDWQRFDIGSAATVNFLQPSSHAVALNRVLSVNPSQIFGHLNANGQVFLTNAQGIYFSPTASVNVGALVATTHEISHTDFMTGNYRFNHNGSTASVLNEGQLAASPGGYIALLASEVRNQGVIVAQGGTVALAAGEAFELQFANGSLANVRVEPATVHALVENGRAIAAPDGTIILSALAADRLQGSVVRNSGTLEAQSLVDRGGVIRLEGDDITLAAGSRIDASGANGGGTVLAGGGWQGSGGMQQARTVTMESGASIDVSATLHGDGGTAVLWSNIHGPGSLTRAQGTILARGGLQGGDGGRIETSGHVLDVGGIRADASASAGQGGEWLLDPYNVTISGGPASGSPYTSNYSPTQDSTILAADIATSLEGGTSVTITTGSSGASTGDITVDAAITKTSGASDVALTLRAANNLIINQAIQNTGGTGKLDLTLDADNDNGIANGAGIVILKADLATGGGDLNFGMGRSFTLGGSTFNVGGDLYIGGSSALAISTGGGNLNVRGETLIGNPLGVTINSAGGNVSFTGSVDSANQYEGIGGSLTWDQALAVARSGTGATIGDTYLVTITSRLENALAIGSVNGQQAWLGGQRVVGIGTNNQWRWVAGPEGLEDSGRGRPFFRQNGSDSVNGAGGTPINNAYSNWNSGEPNNSGGSSLINAAEPALQFVGNQGQWNDLPRASNPLNWHVRETNLAPSPLSITAGAGNVSFGSAVGGSKPLASLNITAASTAINGGLVQTSGNQHYTSNVTLGSANTLLNMQGAAASFTLASGRGITYAAGVDARLTVQTTGNIVFDTGSSVSSANAKLDTVLWADTDASGGGYIQMSDGSAIATHGGHLWMGGGSGTSTWNGLTVGNDYATGSNNGDAAGLGADGIHINGANLNTAGGDIALYGKSSVGNNLAAGIRINDSTSGAASTTIDSGSGLIRLDGVSRGTSFVAGVEFNTNNTAATTTITSAHTTANAITINADARQATTAGWGLLSYYGTLITATGSGGGITITGQISNHGGTAIGFPSPGQTGTRVLANGGPIVFNAVTNGAGRSLYAAGNGMAVGQLTGSPVPTSNSDITLNIDRSMDGTIGNVPDISFDSSGALTIQPITASTTMGISGGTGAIQLPSGLFSGAFTSGFSSLTIGNAPTGTITVGGATTFRDDTTLRTNGSIALNGTTTASKNLRLWTDGSITQTAALHVTGSTELTATTSSDITLTNTANDFGGAVSVTRAQDLALTDSNAMTLGALGTFVANLGKIDISTLSGNLTLSDSIYSSDTTANAIRMNAGRSTAAGTATGGNIIVSGATITTGTGGSATIYTGSVADSTGLTALIGSGSGRFRYNSDETAANYATALGTGVNAIYREQPTVAVTANDASKTYDGIVFSGGNGVTYDGLANGDTSAVLTGTLAYGGASQSAVNAGSYAITPGGLGNGPGYAIAYSNGTLTVNKALLTVRPDDQSRLYGAANPFFSEGTTGFVNGETYGSVGITGWATGSSTATATSNVGTYTITGSIGDLAAPNYDFIAANGTLTINKANATVTAHSDSRTYNGLTQSVSGFTASGLVNGENESVLTGVSTTGGTGTNAGTYTHTASGTDGNYALSFVDGTLSINKVQLTVTADDATKVYDGQSYSGGNGVLYTGFVNGEAPSALSGTLVYGGSSQGARNAGRHVITPSGLSSANYAISFDDGSLLIKARPVTVRADELGKKVGERDPMLTYTTDCGTLANNCGVVIGDQLSGALARTSGEMLGRHEIRQGTLTQPNNPNYLIDFVPAQLTIAEAPLPPPPSVPSALPSASGNAAPTPLLLATDGPVVFAPATTSLSASPDQTGENTHGTDSVLIALTRTPDAGNSGLVTVLIPLSVVAENATLSLPVPTQLFAGAPSDPSIIVSLLDGSPLPTWLRYQPDTRSLIMSTTPNRSLPIQVLVIIDGVHTIVTISERED